MHKPTTTMDTSHKNQLPGGLWPVMLTPFREDNGVDIEGIGLDKAANIFWHTQTNYLTPTSGFADLADGLEQSC